MKALSICQPYAHLIVVTKEKRIENRTWPTNHRGPLAIHASKTRCWLSPGENRHCPGMAFGAIIGLCKLKDCIAIDAVYRRKLRSDQSWIYDHEHTEGPWCFELADVLELVTPIPYRGQLGLFEIPNHLLNSAVTTAVADLLANPSRKEPHAR